MGKGQPSGHTVEIDGRRLNVSNLDKVLYPAAGFRKADVLDYYRRIAPWMLRHLAGRPPTLVRAPDGPGGPRFFEKNCPGHHPDWVGVAPGNEATGGTKGCLVDDLPTLVWLANLAALELHTHQWTLDDPAHPTAMVIDLDPGAPATIVDCCRVALALRDTLARLDLQCVVKTSGGKGLHLSVPVRGSGATDEDTKRFALALGQHLESREPDRVLVDMARAKRPGKVFVDWSQNDRHKTTVCAYSLRLQERPTVSTPLAWSEVEAALDAGDDDALTFEANAVVERAEALGDLYADSLTLHQMLPALNVAGMDLSGKVAIVTGASRGVGAATAELLAQRGCRVACAARATADSPQPVPGTIDETVARIHAAGGEALAVPTNLAHDEDVERMVATTRAHYGRVDVLVNNAAITFPGDLELGMKRFDLVMQVDLRAPLVAIRAAVAEMKEQGGGSIVNVSSVAGLNYIPGLMAYGMAKAALEHLTVSAAAQLRPFDIAVNTFRIDVPVASEGFVFNMPEADHSDWEPSEVAAEGIVWMLEQPPSYTGHNEGMAALRAERGIMASRSARPYHPTGNLVTETHLRPL